MPEGQTLAEHDWRRLRPDSSSRHRVPDPVSPMLELTAQPAKVRHAIAALRQFFHSHDSP